jgi:hypothetical protein
MSRPARRSVLYDDGWRGRGDDWPAVAGKKRAGKESW